MAVTLAQAKLNALDDVQAGIIDEFAKSSYLLDNMAFDDVVTPGTNGASLVYAYTRVLAERGAGFRAYDADYAATQATKTRISTELKPLGGSFEIDRVLAKVSGLSDEVLFQTQQLIKAARAGFHDAAINGDTGVDPLSFDGLDKLLTGTVTEFTPNLATPAYVNWTDVDTQAEAFNRLELIDEWLSSLDEKPNVILGNSKSVLRFKYLARYAGNLTASEDRFGRKIESYDDIAIVDLGAKPGSSNPIIPIETRDADGGGAGGNITGLTDLYAVRFGMDAFHGCALANTDLVHTYLDEFRPEYRQSGVTRKGEVEMVTAVAVKRSKSCGVFRNIKVQ